VLGQAAAAKAFGTLRLHQAAALEYIRLIFATVAGVLVFKEAVGPATLLGGAVILCAAWLGSRVSNARTGESSVATSISTTSLRERSS
jgi:drug/metabolite transporter (DMT)-like permease